MKKIDLSKTLGDNVKIYREKKGFSQKKLANILDVTSNYISQIESGRKYPSLKRIALIAEALETTPSELLNNDPLLEDIKDLLGKYDIDRVMVLIDKMYRKHEHKNGYCEANQC